MTRTIDNHQVYLDARDIIERFEELETELQEAMDANEEGHNLETLEEYVKAVSSDYSAAHAHKLYDEAEEYTALSEFLEELKGNGGDEQWRGDWYPVALIRDSYFKEAMDEMLEDCEGLKPFEQRPCYIKITIDYDALQMDYTSAEFSGVTYWFR